MIKYVSKMKNKTISDVRVAIGDKLSTGFFMSDKEANRLFDAFVAIMDSQDENSPKTAEGDA